MTTSQFSQLSTMKIHSSFEVKLFLRKRFSPSVVSFHKRCSIFSSFNHENLLILKSECFFSILDFLISLRNLWPSRGISLFPPCSLLLDSLSLRRKSVVVRGNTDGADLLPPQGKWLAWTGRSSLVQSTDQSGGRQRPASCYRHRPTCGNTSSI